MPTNLGFLRTSNARLRKRVMAAFARLGAASVLDAVIRAVDTHFLVCADRATFHTRLGMQLASGRPSPHTRMHLLCPCFRPSIACLHELFTIHNIEILSRWLCGGGLGYCWVWCSECIEQAFRGLRALSGLSCTQYTVVLLQNKRYVVHHHSGDGAQHHQRHSGGGELERQPHSGLTFRPHSSTMAMSVPH